MKPVIKINSINKSFGKAHILKDLSFELEQGRWLSIVGKSGSGKTTLLNILSLLDSPSSGEYFLAGEDAAALSDEQKQELRRKKIGLIFQQFHLIPYLSALENVMLAQHYHSSVRESDARAALDLVELADRADNLPSQLSGGQQQRLCIARALVNDPEILFADEPTGNLDEASGEEVIKQFHRLQAAGKTLVLITHNPELAELGDEIITIKDGVIIERRMTEAGKKRLGCES